MEKSKSFRVLGFYFALAIIALIIGYIGFRLFIEPPKVGIVRMSDIVLDQATAQKVLDLLKYAKEEKSIRAIVVELDCPGGEATATEEVYLTLLQLRKEKPVVISVDRVALSGGYYVAVASDFIYAKPTSQVGSIGVWMRLPEIEVLEEDIMPSGPAKSTGGVRKKAAGWVQIAAKGFLQAIITQRGDDLALTKEELSQAEVYLGVEAFRNGLIDKIGTTREAVEKAAALARLRNYREIDINKELNLSLPSQTSFFSRLSPEIGNFGSSETVYPQYYFLDIRARE